MNKIFKSSEEVVSMFLGLVIVLVVVGLIYNYFQKKRGSISLPGVTDNSQLQLAGKPEETKIANNEGNTGTYEVKKGDNLWKIAVAQTGSGYKWTEIAKANNLKNPRVLVVGQKLIIPKTETAVVAKEPVKETVTADNYVVKRGDCLWKIAVAKYADGYQWVKIWKENKNKLKDPNKLEIGMNLSLPSLK